MQLRIINSGPGDAASNMACDRGIIQQVSDDPTHAVLRWYTWEPPAFSLGYGQKPEQLFDAEKLHRAGVAWVKRPTGGSLVYHEGDLSYSFTIPRENPWNVSTSRQLYEFVSSAWMKGFQRLGIPAEVPASVPPARKVPFGIRQLCLAFHSPGDILIRGKKIGGSAQRRLRTVWHQQGFFLLRSVEPPDCFRLAEMVSMMKQSSADLAACGYEVDAETLCEGLSAAMAEILGSVRQRVTQ